MRPYCRGDRQRALVNGEKSRDAFWSDSPNKTHERKSSHTGPHHSGLANIAMVENDEDIFGNILVKWSAKLDGVTFAEATTVGNQELAVRQNGSANGSQ